MVLGPSTTTQPLYSAWVIRVKLKLATFILSLGSVSECHWDWVCVREGGGDDSSAAAGHAVGAVVGNSIMNARINSGVKKYCKKHPGEPFHRTMPDGTVVRSGTCPAMKKQGKYTVDDLK